jgi:vacuolar-type H+-ATPase subunit E/Vma4
MALSDLISRLEQEAQNRVEAIERDAQEQVHGIEVATEQSIAEITARHLEQEHAERQIVQQRELGLARRNARTRELEARRAQLARILNRARALVPEIAATTAYASALPSHLAEALLFLEGLQPQVRCQAVYAETLQPTINRFGAELTIDETIGPGVVVESSDGTVVIDNTLATRLARAETRLTIELSQKLDVSKGQDPCV